MPDGSDSDDDGRGVRRSTAPASLQAVQRGLSQAWRLMLTSQVDEALAILEASERQLNGLSPAVATRYRAATEVLRLAVVAFRDDSLVVLATLIAQSFVEGGPGLGVLLSEARGHMETPVPADHRPPAFTRSEGNGATQSGSSTGDAITGRERDVLAMIGEGYSNKRIARTLEISPETVKSHVKHIFSKLAVSKRSEAVSKAVVLRLL
jgi:LuxR family maltose regulon positive regulatory protein